MTERMQVRFLPYLSLDGNRQPCVWSMLFCERYWSVCGSIQLLSFVPSEVRSTRECGSGTIPEVEESANA